MLANLQHVLYVLLYVWSVACFLSSELCHKDIILLKWARFVLAQRVKDQLWADARHGLGDQAADRSARPAAVPVHHQHHCQRHLWAAHRGSRPTWPLEVLSSPLSACVKDHLSLISTEKEGNWFLTPSPPWQMYHPVNHDRYIGANQQGNAVLKERVVFGEGLVYMEN